ncbi:hypothetical protein HYH02_008615 [Chlamydomonas schloesseri]|uniref:CCT domain-containing protein n=1 Tax=Chlamydomonas schloesseri TaxID=2026947 RepID=A0A836B1Z9_9CHLO|nr:hypothetical protein HYH02_008615 [Chlamydomonas schloesseri]|eukprot:KAG2445147.1 hypothetical protein HYH02_008615 [Chlamydomonas schloesseri]
MCEACHSSNPLAAAHETEPVAPLPSIEQGAAPEPQPLNVPCESVAQSAASPVAWFVDDEKMGAFDVPVVLSPSGSEAVVPVMSAPIEDEFAFAAPATFKEIKDKLEFEALDLDNNWLDMGFDFTDILSDGPSDVGLVPTFDAAAEAADAVADAIVPTFEEEQPQLQQQELVELAPAPEESAVSRKRAAAEEAAEEPAAKAPALTPQALLQAQAAAFQAVPQASALFFQPQMLAALPHLPLLQQPILSAAAPAAAPKSGSAAASAALAAGANLTREQRVARYREKRKNRSFAKTIRYASRKAYAEIRPRIKGRFAKKEEIEAWKAAHGGDDAVVPEVLDAEC